MFRSIPSALALVLVSGAAMAQGSGKALDPVLCGNAPAVTDEIQKYKGELDAGAKILSKLLINGAAKGEVEIERKSVFARMPNGATAQTNYYLQYTVCLTVITDANLATERKVQLLIETRKAFQ